MYKRQAQSQPLYLGKFQVKEIQFPHGMVDTGENVTNVELVYAGPVSYTHLTTTPLRWAVTFSALMVTEPLMAWAEVMVSWLPSTEKFRPVVLLEKV